jgi:hypothetical protein
VPLCPTSCEICSSGTPASESSETNECRSSRGVHSDGLRPGTRAKARRKSRRTLPASILVPTDVVNTRPVSRHRSPADNRSAACCARCLHSASMHRSGRASVRRDLLVLVSPPTRTDRHTSTCGGNDPPASRCTCSQRSARSSSVRRDNGVGVLCEGDAADSKKELTVTPQAFIGSTRSSAMARSSRWWRARQELMALDPQSSAACPTTSADVQLSLKIRILHMRVFRWTNPNDGQNGGQTHS